MHPDNPKLPAVTESTDIVRTLNDHLLPGDTLLVTSPGFTARGMTDVIIAGLEQPVHVLDDIHSHPQLAQLQNWFSQLDGTKMANVVGLGGGSVIDVSKIMAGLFDSSITGVEEVIAQNTILPRVNGKLLVIPTTAGTGAEVTAFATVWDNKTAKKYSINCAPPDEVIFAPELTCTLPRQATLYSALDAISHAVESLWNINRNEQSEKFAIEALADLLDGLPKVLREPGDIEARRQLQWAAFRAGAAINITKTAVAHAISYPLTLHYGVPHGLACSFTLKAIIEDLGACKLKIPTDLADTLVKLLETLHLSDEMAQYCHWQDIFAGDQFYLEPSRSENFLLPVDTNWAKKVALSSA